jgi:hypothetical protein
VFQTVFDKRCDERVAVVLHTRLVQRLRSNPVVLACCCCQGYTGAFIVTSQDNRPSGQGYITFDSKDSQNAAFKVCGGCRGVALSPCSLLQGLP